MDTNIVREKFGDHYTADENTFTMGIDHRLTTHFAERFSGLKVLETCTGAGFATFSLARMANHLITVEINQSHYKRAKV